MPALRVAAIRFGLKPPVLATLEAMLSCLPKGKPGKFVFASNATLAFKRNGISDRTVRRHIAILQDAGFLTRHDSANRKRFTRYNPLTGEVLKFGFDLKPLFERRDELEVIAEEIHKEQQAIRFIKARIRAILADCDLETSLKVAKLLRRSLDLDELTKLHSSLQQPDTATENITQAPDLSATDSQFVRHHHKTEKEEFDSEGQGGDNTDPLTLKSLLSACPSAKSFALSPITNWREAASHAKNLATMMGIDRGSLNASLNSIGENNTTKAVFFVLQLQDRIQRMGPYFHSLTCGKHRKRFDPDRSITRLIHAT